MLKINHPFYIISHQDNHADHVERLQFFQKQTSKMLICQSRKSFPCATLGQFTKQTETNWQHNDLRVKWIHHKNIIVTHRIHVWYINIYLHLGLFFMLNVGKYTFFPMDPMGNYGSIKLSKPLRETPVVSRYNTGYSRTHFCRWTETLDKLTAGTHNWGLFQMMFLFNLGDENSGSSHVNFHGCTVPFLGICDPSNLSLHRDPRLVPCRHDTVLDHQANHPDSHVWKAPIGMAKLWKKGDVNIKKLIPLRRLFPLRLLILRERVW